MKLKDYFSALFQLCYYADKYTIKYVWKNNIKETILKGATFDEIRAEKKKVEKATGKLLETKKQEQKHFEYQLLEGGRVALMSFNDCTDPSGMTVFLDSMITEINAKKVQNLIIDVRKNDGGDSRIGDLIFERISKVPFQQFGKAFMRITPTTQRLLKNAYGDKFLSPTGLYLENEDSLNVPLNNKAHCYTGKVWLLTSNYTFSSAASFSWAFKYFNMGKVVGEETGGMNVCFGDVLEYRLPISQLYCYISYKRFWQYGADETDIHGTIPDIAVPADKALETTLQLIRNKKIKKI
jgi:peptidase, S41 family